MHGLDVDDIRSDYLYIYLDDCISWNSKLFQTRLKDITSGSIYLWSHQKPTFE